MGKGLKTAGIIAGVAATFAAGVYAEKQWQVSSKVANLTKKKEEHDDNVVAQVTTAPQQPAQQAANKA